MDVSNCGKSVLLIQSLAMEQEGRSCCSKIEDLDVHSQSSVNTLNRLNVRLIHQIQVLETIKNICVEKTATVEPFFFKEIQKCQRNDFVVNRVNFIKGLDGSCLLPLFFRLGRMSSLSTVDETRIKIPSGDEIDPNFLMTSFSHA